MKKAFLNISILLFLIFGLSGCNSVGEKSASLTVIYGAAALFSFLLLIVYCFLIRKKDVWFLLLFSSVIVVNAGYLYLAVSTSLSEALMANRIAYLGSVFLPMLMLMIILNVLNIKYSKWLPWCLIGISAFVFFVAASPGYLDIYYKEVSFVVINGVSTLVKVYGPWHSLYLFYLLGYFAAMIAAIVQATVKKTIDSTAHAVILAIAVFVNIGVWFIEQLVSIEFEFLSISYIISELFLLGVNLVMNENERLKELVNQKEKSEAQQPQLIEKSDNMQPIGESSEDAIALFLKGLDSLTPKERVLFDFYVSGETTKDIMSNMNITENTLKFHSKNLYGKLGVSSRKQLMAIYRQINISNPGSDEAANPAGK